MREIRVERNIEWLPQPNELSLVLSDRMPEQRLITCSFVFAFQQDQILLTDLHSRGWDIPGGHIEPGESPEEAVRRELYEEAGATVRQLVMLGYERIRLLGEKPHRYKYPFPDSYMVFYWAQVHRIDNLESNAEVRGRGLFNPLQARTIPWIQDNFDLYEEALRRAGSTQQ